VEYVWRIMEYLWNVCPHLWATLQLHRHLALQKASRKLRAFATWWNVYGISWNTYGIGLEYRGIPME